VPVPSLIAEVLNDHLKRYGLAGDVDALVFSAERSGRLNAANWHKRAWVQARHAAGLPTLRFHDVDDSGGSVAELGLFLAFAHDVIDRYGRLLAFVHRDDPVAQPRPYNEHLLAGGVALPYFIWPNVAPFIREADVPEPGVPIGGAHLDAARNAVATARTAGHLRAARSVAIAAVRTPLSRACYHRHQPSSVGPRPMGH
jgi:hypothetical protein